MKVVVNSDRIAVLRAPTMRGPAGPAGPAGDERLLGFTSMSLSSQALTSISSQSSWTKVLGATALSASSNGFTMPQDNRVVYDLQENGIVTVNGVVSFTSSKDNQDLSFGVSLDGTVVPNSVVSKRIPNGLEVEQVSLIGDFQVIPGQAVEVWVRNDTSSGDVTVSNLYLGLRIHRPFS